MYNRYVIKNKVRQNMILNLLLDEAASTTTQQGGLFNGTTLILPIILVVVMFGALYFFSIRPQRKQEKEANNMRNSLSVGDEVTTIGGIIGRVVSIKDETFVLETTKERTKIRLLRSALKSIDAKVDDTTGVQKTEAPAEDKKEEKKDDKKEEKK